MYHFYTLLYEELSYIETWHVTSIIPSKISRINSTNTFHRPCHKYLIDVLFKQMFHANIPKVKNPTLRIKENPNAALPHPEEGR